MDALNSASNPVPLPVKKIKRKPLKGASSNNSGLGKTSPSLDVFAGDCKYLIVDFKNKDYIRRHDSFHGWSKIFQCSPYPHSSAGESGNLNQP